MRSLLSLTLVTLAVVVIVARGTAGFAVRELPFACESSPLVTAEPSPMEGADPFGTGPWYVNADRTMWAGWDAGHWRVGRNKVLWIRPGRTLTITGTRIDAEAPPLTADIPCCYGSGFQATAVHFPTEGCWRVTAKAGDHEITFVTPVRRGSQ